MFCGFLVVWGLYHFMFEKEGRASRRTKSHLAEEKRARQPAGQESTVECHGRRHHRPRSLPIAPVYKESPAAQAQGLRDQTKSRRKACLELGGEPEEGCSKITCQKAGTSSAQSTAPGE